MKDQHPSFRRFVIAHELGHYVSGLNSDTKQNEAICDAIAVCLVVPWRLLEPRLGKQSHAELALRFATFPEVIAARIAIHDGSWSPSSGEVNLDAWTGLYAKGVA